MKIMTAGRRVIGAALVAVYVLYSMHPFSVICIYTFADTPSCGCKINALHDTSPPPHHYLMCLCLDVVLCNARNEILAWKSTFPIYPIEEFMHGLEIGWFAPHHVQSLYAPHFICLWLLVPNDFDVSPRP